LASEAAEAAVEDAFTVTSPMLAARGATHESAATREEASGGPKQPAATPRTPDVADSNDAEGAWKGANPMYKVG
jgi:hypothetical protein